MRRGFEALRDVVVHDPMVLVPPLVIFAVTFVIGLVVRRMVLRALKAWNARTGRRPSLILYEGLRGPAMMWILILAAHLALKGSEAPARITNVTADILLGLWILSLTIMSMRIAGDLVRFYGGQIPGAMPVTTLTQSLAQMAVLILGVLILLNHFNVSITPMLTALGVGGLAVALALQDTLSNLFGGFYVAIAGQVRLGDYIKLNTGEEGYVTDIGWRSTTMRALANNLIIVPNSKLAQAIVTNYYLPEKRLGVNFAVTVTYDTDLEKVERLLLDVLKQGIAEIPGMVGEPAPGVAFDPGFGESGIGLTVNFHVAEFANQFSVRNELRRRIFFAFKQNGVVVPYPARSVYLHDGKFS